MAGRPGLPVLELNGGTGFGYEWKDQICAEPVPRFPSTVWGHRRFARMAGAGGGAQEHCAALLLLLLGDPLPSFSPSSC